MAWAYVLWATAGGKNFSLSVIWNCGVTLRRTPRGSGCVCSSFSFHSPYTSCTSVVIRSTSIDLKPECNEVNYDHDDPEKIFLTPFKLKMASNGSMVTLRPQKSSHVGWFSWSAERLRVAVD